MKAKIKRRKDKLNLTKKNMNIPNIQTYFKFPVLKINDNSNSNNKSPIHQNSNSNRPQLVKNPSKIILNKDINNEITNNNPLIEKYILLNSLVVDILYSKLDNSFEKIHFFLSKSKLYNIDQNDFKNIIIKFILQLKYVDIIYISDILLSNNLEEQKISENIQNFCGYNSTKKIIINSFPSTHEEFDLYMHNIYEIISNYLNFPYESKGLYIYVKNDYQSFFHKIKLICNLYNFELKIIDENIESKNLLLDKISEAMKTKRLPSIPDLIDSQLSLLENITYNYIDKWKVFNNNTNGVKYNNELENNIENKSIDMNFNQDNQIINLSSESESLIDLNSLSDHSKIIHITDENAISNNISEINQDSNIYSTSETFLNLEYNKSNFGKNKLEIIKNYYIKQNIKENNSLNGNNLYKKLQNNIFSFCNKTKTAILIIDSFSNGDSDKKYFNNILSKVSQTKCPIIILTDNIENIVNNSQKKLKNLKMNLILNNKSNFDKNLIYLYSFVIYINIKLAYIKFEKNIKTYEDLIKIIQNIEIDKYNYELNNNNLQKIYELSKYLCFKHQFQTDVIDFKLGEIFFNIEIEKEVSDKINDFNFILEYLYNRIFDEKIVNNYNDFENIEKISQDYDLFSFWDYCQEWEEMVGDRIYREKLKMNDCYENYLKNKNFMVNLENITLKKFLDSEEVFNKYLKRIFEEEKIYLFINFSNNLLIEIHKENQLFLSFIINKYVSLSFIQNYNFIIKNIIIKENYNNKRNKNFNKLIKKMDNILDFISFFDYRNIFTQIKHKYFLNKKKLNLAKNINIMNTIYQKKTNIQFYE